MKQYDEINFGIPYHVIEYDHNDCISGAPSAKVIDELITAKVTYKYLKVIDKYFGDTNYYMDGMKHNDFGPSFINNGKEKFYVLNKRIPNDEFKNWRRTKLIDDILDEKR